MYCIFWVCCNPTCSCVTKNKLQLANVQFIGREMLYRLCRQLPAQIPYQARGDMCTSMCWEILEAFNACWHEICRAQPRSSNIRLRNILTNSYRAFWYQSLSSKRYNVGTKCKFFLQFFFWMWCFCIYIKVQICTLYFFHTCEEFRGNFHFQRT